jgi:hypothetical protein
LLRRTLDVVKKAKITVSGQPATLKDVRRGQKAVAVFNTELEVVTRLAATGEGVAPLVPEITVLMRPTWIAECESTGDFAEVARGAGIGAAERLLQRCRIARCTWARRQVGCP